MAAIRSRKVPFEIHHDAHHDGGEEDDLGIGEERDSDDDDLQNTETEAKAGGGDDSFSTENSEESVDSTTRDDIAKFQEAFEGIADKYRLINKIGEGTFSTVYKAEDLRYEEHDNSWDLEAREKPKWQSPADLKKRRDGTKSLSSTTENERQRRRPKYVAIKKIYVTSSPQRIHNELELLHDLQSCDSVCPLITAFRCTDQVVAVLPYFSHKDFRLYFRDMTVPDMQIYFRSLFTALAAVHDKGILHRDIKPTNFLYDPDKKRGVLVDFGLAEREGTDRKPCLCEKDASERRRRLHDSVGAQNLSCSAYPKNDSRPSRRANRAGTRGFRAPEVLFKCTAQTPQIDIWSAGVILLTILSKRFPFFNSADDVEAMIEISTMLGQKKMKACANLHGTLLETTIPTISIGGFGFEKIILWSTCRNDGDGGGWLNPEEKMAVRFLERCLDYDPSRRITAIEALSHPFLAEKDATDDDDELDLIQ